MFISKALRRSRARFNSLFETIKDEYWKTHENFEDYGCSLRPIDISKRSAKAATWASGFVIFVTLPVILYYRGISEPSLFFGLALEFGVAWFLFYVLVFAAHILWALSFIAGSKVGGSNLFLNYVGKRWGKRIDEIFNNFIAENKIEALQFQKSELDNDDGIEDAINGMDINNNNEEKVATSTADGDGK